MAERGRPPKLTRRTLDKMLSATKQGGCWFADLAPIAGVVRDTVREWMRRGEAEEARCCSEGCKPSKEEKNYYDFSVGYQKALLIWEQRHKANVERAGNGWTEKKTKTVTKKINDIETEVTETVEEVDKFSWQASMTLLERRIPDKYGRRAPVHVEDTEADQDIQLTLDDGMTIES